MLVIHQTNLGGHRLEYVKHVLDWANARREQTLLWINGEAEREELVRMLNQVSASRVEFSALSPSRINDLTLNKPSTRHVFLDGDNVLFFLLRNFRQFKKTKVTLLLMRLNPPTSLFDLRAWIVLATKYLMLFCLKLLIDVKICRLTFLQKKRLSFVSSVRDPLPLSNQKLSRPSQKDRAKVIAIIGTIDPRKSVNEAAAAVELLGPGHQLLLKGKVSGNYKDELSKLNQKHKFLIVEDHLLSEGELTQAFVSVDVFLCLQKVNAPSGTLLRALSAGTPTVLAGSKILKLAASLYPDNVVWSALKPGALSSSIEKALRFKANKVQNLPSPSDFTEDLMG